MGEIIVLVGEDFVCLLFIVIVVEMLVGSIYWDVCVELISMMIEVGMLEVYCVSVEDVVWCW